MDDSQTEKGLRILVVEDSDRLRRSLCLALGRFGHRVDDVADGELALELARSNVYDVILLDLLIPKLDGVSLLEAHHAEALPGRVLVMSARESERDRARCLELGVDQYISKPFAIEELEARLDGLR